MSAIALDIETAPSAAALALPYPASDREPPASYKKEESIAEWRRKDREEWETARIKTYSLSPLWGRVVAVGIAREDDLTGDVVTTSHVGLADADERRLLTAAWEAVADSDPLVTFNGMGFDLPFLAIRSAILGVTPSVIVNHLLRRYSWHPHYDVRMALTNWDQRGRGTMDDACAAFGLPPKTGTGADVWPLVQQGAAETLAAYVQADAERTLALYTKLCRVFD